MFKYVIWAIVIYCLIRFIFNFVIPVIRAARQMKNQVKDFQDKMGSQQFQGNVQDEQPTQSPRHHSPKPKSEDYIDFEEVK
jgi:hypothetical protein